MTIRLIQITVLTTAMLMPFGCQSLYGQLQAPRGETVAGGVAGAIIGGIVGKQNDETPEGIAIGAAIGAIAGSAVGNSRDQAIAQEQAYRQAQWQRQQAHQQAQQHAFRRAASIDDVISMTQSGLGSSVIVNHIQSVGVQQEIGVPEIIALHRSGVDEQVIKLMQQLGTGRTTQIVQPRVVQPQIVQQPVVEHTVIQPIIQPVIQPVFRPTPIVVNRYQVPPKRPRPHYSIEAQRRHGHGHGTHRAYRGHNQYPRR